MLTTEVTEESTEFHRGKKFVVLKSGQPYSGMFKSQITNHKSQISNPKFQIPNSKSAESFLFESMESAFLLITKQRIRVIWLKFVIFEQAEKEQIMDPTSQIKKNLISRIQNSNDINFLKALKIIIDSSEEVLTQLTQKQQSSIENGRNQIKNGDFIENDKLISELKEWLAKK